MALLGLAKMAIAHLAVLVRHERTAEKLWHCCRAMTTSPVRRCELSPGLLSDSLADRTLPKENAPCPNGSP
jgi:hypothetical protein